MKVNGLSLSTKVSIIVLSIILFNTISIGVMSFIIQRDDTIKSSAEKAMAIAKTAAASISPDEFRYAIDENFKSAHYEYLLKQFNRIKNEEHLLYFFAGTFDENNGMIMYLDANSPSEEHPFKLNDAVPLRFFPQAAFDAFNDGKAYTSDVYRLNINKRLGVSAFAPILDENEQPIGLVGVIRSVEEVLSHSRSFAFSMLMVSLVLFAAIVWIPILYIRRFVAKPIQALQAATEKIASGDMYIHIPMRTANDEIGMLSRNFSTMTQEINKQKELLLAAAKEANSANEAKSNFLAKMSHEIRTPMNAILGIAEIQLRDETLSQGTEEAIRKIYESGDVLLNIINDILDLSKIEAGKLELIPIKYDIPSLINDTMQLNRLRYDAKPIELSISVDENTPHYLFGDELRIKQVLNNILSNAFKYTDEGSVSLSVYPEFENSDGDNVIIVFHISDTGQGMTTDQIKELFDEYTRFNAVANRETIGTGLGMSITKHLLELMNGTIFVKSEPGKGTEFIVRIPQQHVGLDVCGAEITEKLRNFNFRSTTLTNKTQFLREHMPYGSVLVVDDVESNIYVTKGMLMPYGIKVDSASSGFEAIEKIEEGNVYDIVFMDHMMPKMDGIETTKRMRGMGYNHKIVALTANAIIGRAEMFLKNGFDGFISKPIDSRELNLMLNELIRNKKPPEIVEAARQEMAQLKKNQESAQQQPPKTHIDSELKKAAIHDIENVLAVLGDKLPRISTGKADLGLYATTVHGMKSALANIGEVQLSAIALKLEHAAKNNETDTLLDETPDFMKSLYSLLDKLNKRDTDESSDVPQEISSDDEVFLKDNLNAIRTACENLVLKDAKKALIELKKKKWPRQINDIIDEISLYLIRGEYLKVVSVVNSTANI